MQDLWLEQQLFAACPALVDQDGRINALFSHAPVKVNLTVARAFELFVNDLIHAAAGVNQCGADDGQRTAFFDISRSTKKAFGPLQRVRINAARQHLARGWQHVVVGPRQACNGVQQDDHILLQLDQAFGAFNHHFSHLHVARCRFVEGRADDLATHGAQHLGHFFRAFVHQQNDEMHLGVVGHDGVRQVLHHHRLARLGLRH